MATKATRMWVWPWLLLVASSGSALLLLLYFRLDPAQYPFPRCPVNWLTGLHCPGCGTQRAIHALLRGQVKQAASFNLLAVGYAPVVVFGLLAEGREWLTKQVYRTSFLYQAWFGSATLAIVLLFTVLRNCSGDLAAWLAP